MTNKKDLYNARHRLPANGSVRGSDGRVWHAKANGQWWYTDEAGQPALSVTKLSEEHRPLILVDRPVPLRSVLSAKAMPRG
jgi:hypothetical protein